MSLANFTRWLATQAESLGVEIFPGFTAAEVIFEEKSSKEFLQGKWEFLKMVKKTFLSAIHGA